MTAFGGALSDPTDVMTSRIGAFIVDSVLATAIALVLFSAFGSHAYLKLDASAGEPPVCSAVNRGISVDPITPGYGGSDPDLNGGQAIQVTGGKCFVLGDTAYVLTSGQATDLQGSLALFFYGTTFLNAVLLQGLTGASVGKRLFGLRVALGEGIHAGVLRNFVRWLVMIVDLACCGLPGLITAYNSKGHRRLGDMAAGTLVVHRSAMGRPLHVPGVVIRRTHDQFGGWGPATTGPALSLEEGGGIDAPAWDPARNAYVRYDQGSGVWFRWDDAQQAWLPVDQ
ncbi:MAG: RDD family protein [Acidimicrobiales bacterium]